MQVFSSVYINIVHESEKQQELGIVTNYVVVGLNPVAVN